MNDPSSVLQQLIERALPEAITEAIELSCQKIENDAKRDCPVDDGTLRASITHTIHLLDNSMGKVGTNVEYAPYVHEGTGIYAVGGMGRKRVPWIYKDEKGEKHATKGSRPQPFLLNAVNKNKKLVLEIFKAKCSVQNLK